MLKLYRAEQGRSSYWETWQDAPGAYFVHWGELGTVGEATLVTASLFRSAERRIRKAIDAQKARGFREIAPEEHAPLVIAYAVDGTGTESGLAGRRRLEERVSATLGWTGLGHCHGGRASEAAMEVVALVVDFDLARQVIEQDLASTEFAGCVRICR